MNIEQNSRLRKNRSIKHKRGGYVGSQVELGFPSLSSASTHRTSIQNLTRMTLQRSSIRRRRRRDDDDKDLE